MPTRVPALVTLLLTLGTAGLTGCGGDSDASADPPQSPPATSTAPSTSPTAAPTEAPPGETARQFIERWFALEKYAQNTGDTRPYRKITSGCEPCAGFADQVESIYGRGGSIFFEGTQVISATRIKSAADRIVYDVRISAPPAMVAERAGSKPRAEYGGRDRYQVELSRPDGRWRLAGFYRVASQ